MRPLPPNNPYRPGCGNPSDHYYDGPSNLGGNGYPTDYPNNNRDLCSRKLPGGVIPQRVSELENDCHYVDPDQINHLLFGKHVGHSEKPFLVNLTEGLSADEIRKVWENLGIKRFRAIAVPSEDIPW